MSLVSPKVPVTAGIIVSSIALLYVVCRSIVFFSYTSIVIWPDSADYAKISTQSIWSEGFWLAHRPPAYPYLLKSFSDSAQQDSTEPVLFKGLLGYTPKVEIGRGLDGDPDFVDDLAAINITSLSVFQFVFSVFSWIVFASICTATIRQNWLRAAGFSILLLISFDQNITIWDRHVLTESLSISLFLLCISLPFLFIRREQGTILLLVCVSAFVYAAIKGVNAYMLLAMSFLLFVLPFLLNKKRKGLFVLCGFILLGISAVNLSANDRGYRGVVPLMNVLNSRIIAEGYEDIYAEFRESGLPDVPEEFFEQHWHAQFDSVPGLKEWLVDEGPGVYKRYLITHPVYLFARPFTTPESTYNRPVYFYYDSYLALYGQSTAVGPTLFFEKNSFLTFQILGLIAFAAALRFINRSNYFEVAYFSYIFMAGILMSLVVWHGDVIEINRHMVQVTIQLRLAIILVALYSVSILCSHVRFLEKPLRDSPDDQHNPTP